MTNTKKITEEYMKMQEESQKENNMKEEIEQAEQAEQSKPMFTISKDMVVVETINLYSNPSSYSYEAMKLFLDNNFNNMKEYFEDGNNNGIAFYECGYNGAAQQDFIKEWLENGVRVF